MKIKIGNKFISDKHFPFFVAEAGINYDGDEMEIGFNSKYILEMINNLEDDEITLYFKNSSSPVTAMEISNPDLIYVLMPMRV